ncbi:MAG: hypothetical protein ACI4JS_07475 [Oscillospiraceae bacterium]
MENTELTFKEYVDKYILENTGYKSADDLLGAKVKTPFFSGGKLRKLRLKYVTWIPSAIDLEDLIRFLDSYMKEFSGFFGRWSLMVMKQPGVVKSALTGDNNQRWQEVPFGDESLENKYDEYIIGTAVEGKENILAQISITHEGFNPSKEKRRLFFSVTPRVFLAPCPSEYSLSVKAIPIMHAALDYYLNEYLNKNE